LLTLTNIIIQCQKSLTLTGIITQVVISCWQTLSHNVIISHWHWQELSHKVILMVVNCYNSHIGKWNWVVVIVNFTLVRLLKSHSSGISVIFMTRTLAFYSNIMVKLTYGWKSYWPRVQYDIVDRVGNFHLLTDYGWSFIMKYSSSRVDTIVFSTQWAWHSPEMWMNLSPIQKTFVLYFTIYWMPL
jgi:hypothetical protein